MDLEETTSLREEDGTKNDAHGNPGPEERKGDREQDMIVLDGLHLSKRTLWMVAGGATGAMAFLGLGKVFGLVRPAAVCALKEGYGFKEWLAGKLERAKEDIQDVVAEAVFSYHEDVAATAETVKREKEILEKVEKVLEERMLRPQAEKKDE